MPIEKHKVVSLDYVLKNDAGKIVDKSEGGTFIYLHGAHNIIPGLENALADKSVGDKLSVRIAPEDAYGLRNEEMAQTVPRSMFEDVESIEVGQQFHAQSPEGQMLTVTITKIKGDEITVDGNHPLAGEYLNFNVTVVNIRDASEEEIAHGHVHGPGGHHHHG